MLFFPRILRCTLAATLLISCMAVNGQRIDTTSSDGLFQAARRAAFDRKDYAQAKAYLWKGLRISPDYSDLSIFLGRIHSWTNHYDSARIYFDRVLSRQPDYEDAVLASADLEYLQGNYERALAISRAGIRNNPTSEELMLREAKTLNALKRYDDADRAVTKLLYLNPGNADAIALSKSFRGTGSKNSDTNKIVPPASGQDTVSSDALFQLARKAAFDNNDYPAAKALLFRALRLSPDYSDIRIFLGRIYTWTKNYDSGRLAFQQVLARQPASEDAYAAYAALEYFSGNYQASLDIVNRGLAQKPHSEPLLLHQAKAFNALKRPEEARQALDKILAINPNDPEAKALANSIANAAKPAPVPYISPESPVQRDTASADGLLTAARRAAFDNKDHEQAKSILYHALAISPNYADIKIFLGRIHTWNSNYDSARYYFSDVLRSNPGYEDAAVAYGDMEYWNSNYDKALSIVSDALVLHPSSEDLLVRKAKILSAMRRYGEADNTIQEALRINKNNTDARAIAMRIKEQSSSNKIGFSYDYVYFDKQFADPWHLASFDYTRRTGIGSITGRINYAIRFKENGVQYELDAYPRISKTFYTYLNAGYSDNVGVFPNWRGGFSLYANLPKSFEGELGVRYLKFSGDPTWIYTAYLGKYYKSWLFSGRTYLTPSTFASAVSASYSVAARYYYGSADDMIGATMGYGISPDDRFNSIQIDSKIRLVSYKAGLSFKKKLSRFSVLSLDGSWVNQEYLPQTKGNQYQFSLGWLLRF
ncbi:MAG: hypothetical protein JWQ78_1018 [Sediminibacterium sp.]|nr:hypothetical protein [Sediminibacterium sp.]